MQPDFHAQSDHFVDIVPSNVPSKGRRDLKQAWHEMQSFSITLALDFFGTFRDKSSQKLL